MDIHVLHKQRLGIRAIARKLGLSKNTVRRNLRHPIFMPSYSPRAKRPTKKGRRSGLTFDIFRLWNRPAQPMIDSQRIWGERPL